MSYGDIIQLVTNFGALGILFWLVIHHTKYTWPNIVKTFAENLESQVKKFEEILECERQAFIRRLDEEHKSFELLLYKQDIFFAEQMNYEREFRVKPQ